MNQAHLPDLQFDLQNDASGGRRLDVLARLRSLHDDCLAAKRQLSDREAYQRLHAATVAVTAAIRIVEALPQQAGDGN